MSSERIAPQTLIRPLTRPPPGLRPGAGSSPEGEGALLSFREREAAKRQGEGSLARAHFIMLRGAWSGSAFQYCGLVFIHRREKVWPFTKRARRENAEPEVALNDGNEPDNRLLALRDHTSSPANAASISRASWRRPSTAMTATRRLESIAVRSTPSATQTARISSRNAGPSGRARRAGRPRPRRDRGPY